MKPRITITVDIEEIDDTLLRSALRRAMQAMKDELAKAGIKVTEQFADIGERR